MLNSLISKLNPNAELTPEDRTIYASKLEYIASKTDELENCEKNASDLSEKMKTIDKQIQQLESTISERQRNYNKISGSIQRLTDTIKGFKYVAEATKETWNKFEGIEKMIEAEERKKEEVEKEKENEKNIKLTSSTEELLKSMEIPALNEESAEDIVEK